MSFLAVEQGVASLHLLIILPVSRLPVKPHSNPDSNSRPNDESNDETDNAGEVGHVSAISSQPSVINSQRNVLRLITGYCLLVTDLVPGARAFKDRKADKDAKDETDKQTNYETDDERHFTQVSLEYRTAR